MNIEKFNEDSSSIIDRYKELDSKCKKLELLISILDNKLKPLYKEIDTIKDQLYSNMVDSELTSYTDDRISITKVEPTVSYSVAKGLNPEIKDLLLRKKFITRTDKSGYIKSSIIYPEGTEFKVEELYNTLKDFNV